MEHLGIVTGGIAEKMVEALVVKFPKRISNGGVVCPIFLTLEDAVLCQFFTSFLNLTK